MTSLTVPLSLAWLPDDKLSLTLSLSLSVRQNSVSSVPLGVSVLLYRDLYHSHIRGQGLPSNSIRNALPSAPHLWNLLSNFFRFILTKSLSLLKPPMMDSHSSFIRSELPSVKRLYSSSLSPNPVPISDTGNFDRLSSHPPTYHSVHYFSFY